MIHITFHFFEKIVLSFSCVKSVKKQPDVTVSEACAQASQIDQKNFLFPPFLFYAILIFKLI